VKNLLIASFVLTATAISMSGCNKEPSAKSAAADLERAFQITTPDSAPAPSANRPTESSDPIKSEVTKATLAMRTNGYAEAFFTLQAVQAKPKLTVDQYDAIEKARIALDHEIANKALAGDEAARKALERMNKSH